MNLACHYRVRSPDKPERKLFRWTRKLYCNIDFLLNQVAQLRIQPFAIAQAFQFVQRQHVKPRFIKSPGSVKSRVAKFGGSL